MFKYEFLRDTETGQKRMKMVGWKVPGGASGIIMNMSA